MRAVTCAPGGEILRVRWRARRARKVCSAVAVDGNASLLDLLERHVRSIGLKNTRKPMVFCHPIAIQLIAKDQIGSLIALRFIVSEIIVAHPELRFHLLTPLGDPVLALLRECIVSHVPRHALGHADHCQVNAPDVWRHSEPSVTFKPLQAPTRRAMRLRGVAIARRNRHNALRPRPELDGVDHRLLDRRIKLLKNLIVPGALPVAVEHIHIAWAVESILDAGRGRRHIARIGRRIALSRAARAAAKYPRGRTVLVLVSLIPAQRGKRQIRKEID